MLDSGSEPSVANCKETFPDHVIHESEGQRKGVTYRGAICSLAPNEGKVHIQNREKDGAAYAFTCQHAAVHCPTLSVTQLAARDCTVACQKFGGYILYQHGNTIRFIARGIVRTAECSTSGCSHAGTSVRSGAHPCTIRPICMVSPAGASSSAPAPAASSRPSGDTRDGGDQR